MCLIYGTFDWHSFVPLTTFAKSHSHFTPIWAFIHGTASIQAFSVASHKTTLVFFFNSNVSFVCLSHAWCCPVLGVLDSFTIDHVFGLFYTQT